MGRGGWRAAIVLWEDRQDCTDSPRRLVLRVSFLHLIVVEGVRSEVRCAPFLQGPLKG